MTRKIEMIGQAFGRLTVVSEAAPRIPAAGKRRTRYECSCECGGTKTVDASNLRTGKTTSCGCVQKERSAARQYKHGHADTQGCGVTATYRTWTNMRARCEIPSASSYDRYGGRGIKVAPEMRTFEGFLAVMGVKPGPEYSIDRIDPRRGYEIGNVRWLTLSENSARRRTPTDRTVRNSQAGRQAAWAGA